MEIDKPKYQRLKEYIIETIKSGKIGVDEKIYSENELAEALEISRNTVRQGIGELVNEGWLYRIQGKGTFVNKPPVQKGAESKTIAVVTTYLNDYIFPSIIRGIDSVLSSNEYGMILSCTYNHHQRERVCLENLLRQDVCAVIVEATKSALPNPNIDLYKKFEAAGIPITFIHSSYKELEASYVFEDDFDAGYVATKHLLDLGHEKIAGIFKIDDTQGHLRFSGFQKAHVEAGEEVCDERIMWFETNDLDSRFDIHNSYLKKLLSECTALVCYNDQIALRVIDLLREMELKIPEDLSLVSFDDSQLALASEVKLTTVAHPKEALGIEAAKATLAMVSGRKDLFQLKMKPELIIRNSTKKNGR